MAEDQITISDCNGAHVLRYWKLGDNRYFGGTVADWARELMPFAYGPHVWHTSLLGIIADVARMDAELPFMLDGAASGIYDRVAIGRQMRADAIARIVGCTEQEVRDFYRLVIEVPDGDVP